MESDLESVVNSSVALGFANLTVKRNPREEAVDRAGRARGRRGDVPLVAKERFDDFEGRGVSNRRDRPAGRNGPGVDETDGGVAVPSQARRKSVLLHVTGKSLGRVCGKGGHASKYA